jgi:hypothetical protein
MDFMNDPDMRSARRLGFARPHRPRPSQMKTMEKPSTRWIAKAALNRGHSKREPVLSNRPRIVLTTTFVVFLLVVGLILTTTILVQPGGQFRSMLAAFGF